jgi:hypothetical protein
VDVQKHLRHHLPDTRSINAGRAEACFMGGHQPINRRAYCIAPRISTVALRAHLLKKESKRPPLAKYLLARAPRSPSVLLEKILKLPAVLSHVADPAADSQHVIDAPLEWICRYRLLR